jgi:hypothetical protein
VEDAEEGEFDDELIVRDDDKELEAWEDISGWLDHLVEKNREKEEGDSEEEVEMEGFASFQLFLRRLVNLFRIPRRFYRNQNITFFLSDDRGRRIVSAAQKDAAAKKTTKKAATVKNRMEKAAPSRLRRRK